MSRGDSKMHNTKKVNGRGFLKKFVAWIAYSIGPAVSLGALIFLSVAKDVNDVGKLVLGMESIMLGGALSATTYMIDKTLKTNKGKKYGLSAEIPSKVMVFSENNEISSKETNHKFSCTARDIEAINKIDSKYNSLEDEYKLYTAEREG